MGHVQILEGTRTRIHEPQCILPRVRAQGASLLHNAGSRKLTSKDDDDEVARESATFDAIVGLGFLVAAAIACGLVFLRRRHSEILRSMGIKMFSDVESPSKLDKASSQLHSTSIIE